MPCRSTPPALSVQGDPHLTILFVLRAAACSNNLIWSFDINSLSNPTAQWADCGRTNFVARGGFCAHNDMLFTVDSEAVWCRSLQKEAQWTKHSDGPPVQGKGGGQKRAAAEPVVTFEGDVRALKQVRAPHPPPPLSPPSCLEFRLRRCGRSAMVFVGSRLADC